MCLQYFSTGNAHGAGLFILHLSPLSKGFLQPFQKLPLDMVSEQRFNQSKLDGEISALTSLDTHLL